MEKIEFGLGLHRLETVAEDAKKAESLGYEFLSTGEHVFFYGPVGNGLIFLAAAAGATANIKLMSAITLVPLYPAALLAKQVAALDVLSSGRFHLGVGVGGEFAKEFEACGVPVSQRGARTDEALDVLKPLWSQDNVIFEGRFTNLPGVTLSPKPVQQPHPPIWISGRSEAAMKRCAKYGTGWLPYMYTPERLASSLQMIQDLGEEIRREEPVSPGLYIFFAVHEDRDVAINMATERLSAQYNQDFSQLVGRYALAGNPGDCIARLQEYVDAGTRTVILNSACPGGYMTENEKLFAEEVLPAFRVSFP